MNGAHPAGAKHARHPRTMLAGAVALILMLSWRGECLAYIDPNAGGFLAQILAPLAAISVSFLFYCRRQITRFVKAIRNRGRQKETPAVVSEAEK